MFPLDSRQFRGILDPFVAKYAASGIEKSKLEELERTSLAGTSSPCDWEFGRRFSCDLHSLIYRSCGNKFLIEIYEKLRLRLDLGMNHLQTLPVGLSSLLDENRTEYGMLMAIDALSLIPSLAFFAWIQRYLTTGLSAGAVKG